MRIGALAAASGVSVRMLRHYEQKGLLSPSRGPNGYREYRQAHVVRAQLISSLIRSGLPTRLISAMLDETAGKATADAVAVFQAELERLERRLVCLTLSRDSVRRYLQDGPGAVLRQDREDVAVASPPAAEPSRSGAAPPA